MSTNSKMWKTCCLIVLYFFILAESSIEVDHPNVDLRCDPKEHLVEFGKNLTINCVLDSTRHPQNALCEVDEKRWPECLRGGQDCNCDWTVGSYSSGIQKVAVEIYNVTIPGTYNIAIPHTCGPKENDSIKIDWKPEEYKGPTTTPTPPSKQINHIMGGVAVVLVVAIIAAAATVCIRRRRFSTSNASQTKYQPATQV